MVRIRLRRVAALAGAVLLCASAGLSATYYAMAISVPVAFSQSDDPRIRVFETSLIKANDGQNRDPRRWTVFERMEHYRVPGVAVAILENGTPVLTRGYGTTWAGGAEEVNDKTVFSMGSVSKVVNAALLLRVADMFDLDLEADVNAYLTSWQVPENEFTARRKVTLRMLLAHTSGLSQHGFADFAPEEALPTALQTLDGLTPAKHPPVRVQFEPGTAFDYSGGGSTVIQVLVEDVTGLSYPEAARRYVFEPLNMTRSTFENPLPETHGNIARSHDHLGHRQSLPRGYESMPEMAASGLWTSAEDMGHFLVGLMSDGFLSDEARDDMFTRVANSRHGLGPLIFPIPSGVVFHHRGSNEHYQTWLEGHSHTGAGLMIMTNGTRGRALAEEIRAAVAEAFDWPLQDLDNFD